VIFFNNSISSISIIAPKDRSNQTVKINQIDEELGRE